MPFWSEDYCDSCDRTFVHRDSLEQHWLNSTRHVWCQRCDIFFRSKKALQAHTNNSQSHWVCHKCQLDYPSEADFQEHFYQTVNHNTCEVCEKDFDTPSQLHSHSVTHFDRRIPCFACGDNRKFATYSAMLIHLETGNCSTSTVLLDSYARKCYQAKQYVTEGFLNYLLKGKRAHDLPSGGWNSEIGSWECNNCYKAFGTKVGLNNHLNSPVHDALAYKCPGCHERFSVLSALVQHVESESCSEGLLEGSGSIAKMLHFLHLKLCKDVAKVTDEDDLWLF